MLVDLGLFRANSKVRVRVQSSGSLIENVPFSAMDARCEVTYTF